MADAPTVQRDDENNRYVLTVDGETAGFAEVVREGSRARFVHTQIDPEFRGRGLSEILAAEALGDAARSGDTIVPLCPFMAKYLRSHDVAGAVVDWPDDEDAQESATPGESPA